MCASIDSNFTILIIGIRVKGRTRMHSGIPCHVLSVVKKAASLALIVSYLAESVKMSEKEEEEDEELRLEKPKGSKSPYWAHFAFVLDKDGKRKDEKHVRCNLCASSVGFSGNTTNLKQHIASRHPVEYMKICGGSSSGASDVGKAKQTTLEAFSAGTSKVKLAHDSKRAKEITKAIAEFIARDMRPVAVVEGDGFLQMMHTLEPAYQVPSRRTVMKYLTDMQDKIKASLLQEMDRMEFVSLTTDFWTSKAVDSYLGITAHFVTPDWKLESRVLQTAQMEEQHTAPNVADELEKAVEEWRLTNKLVATTTDNGRNIVKAVKENLQWQHFPCFGHTLQISVKAGLNLPPVSEIISRSRKLVRHFRHSYVAQAALKAKQEHYGLPEHKLIQDVSTRWNSTYDMLMRVLEQQQAISAVLLESRKGSYRDLIPSSTQLSDMESVAGVLKPLAIATTTLCTEKTPSLSLVQPVLKALLRKHLAASEEDSEIVAELKSTIRSSIERHFSDPEQTKMMLLASILDPHFKALKFLPSVERSQVYEHMLVHVNEAARDVDESSPVKRQKRSVDSTTQDIFDFTASSDSNGDSPSIEPSSAVEKEVNQCRVEEPIGRDDGPAGVVATKWTSFQGPSSTGC